MVCHAPFKRTPRGRGRFCPASPLSSPSRQKRTRTHMYRNRGLHFSTPATQRAPPGHRGVSAPQTKQWGKGREARNNKLLCIMTTSEPQGQELPEFSTPPLTPPARTTPTRTPTTTPSATTCVRGRRFRRWLGRRSRASSKVVPVSSEDKDPFRDILDLSNQDENKNNRDTLRTMESGSKIQKEAEEPAPEKPSSCLGRLLLMYSGEETLFCEHYFFFACDWERTVFGLAINGS